MQCDVCSSPGTGTRIGPQDMRKAVSSGFDPFSRGIVSQQTKSQWSNANLYGSSDPLKNWRENLVAIDQSDWNLCSNCMSAVRQYLTSSPKPVGNPTFDEYVAGKVRGSSPASSDPAPLSGYKASSGSGCSLLLSLVALLIFVLSR